MFRVSFFVDDRKLGDALRALVGYAHGQPEVTPVVNAESTGSGLKAKTNGSAGNMFVDWIRREKLTEVRAAEARKFLKSIGRSEASATYTLNYAQELGAIKKKPGTSGASTVYFVQPEKK